ncbi:transcriptional regulator with XRE-family HTH domain [Peribacillus deserti]|uniref:Transcriptional regulator with XRE-family HTH domain n=1 Tax=Peribacillus deserti TaxID=673318 RepID=A0ABS2QKG7_9BACI|nr:cupin domain-containing protein [Peribacillus deserti]MBM7693665.1 transcriptional regulator with XRE-family HTH domain [Peribacillus deserti]
MESRLEQPAELPKELIGNKIRHYRKTKGYTTDKLGELIGVSQSLISQIERGLAAPSLDTLWKLSYFLEVDVFTFFEDQEPESVKIIRQGEHRKLQMSRPEVWYEMLTPNTGKKYKFFKMILQAAQTKEQPLMFHNGEESGYMLQGSMEVTIGDQVYEIHEGDSITFDSTSPHSFKNTGSIPAVGIWMMSLE